MTRAEGPLSKDNTPVWLQAKHGGTKRRQSNSTSSEEEAIWFMGGAGQDNAMAIVGGVDAWKALTRGKGPLWRRFNTQRSSRRQSQESTEKPLQIGTFPSGHPIAGHPAGQPAGHPAAGEDDPENLMCPFASMADLGKQDRNQADASTSQRPDLLPTPPHTLEHFHGGPAHEGDHDRGISPPPSVSGSVSKCPIRMFDERSPEEIAEYFETHKHEIPRSHEICVKRYQSNAASIRQLDAKYGNLVNMIQGLGMKHQPMLPSKEDEEEFADMDAKSIKKVEKWADNVKENPEEPDLHSALLEEPSDTDDREGHFDRPLKEVRVGESPSRPWGIPVPGAVAAKHPLESEAAPTPKGAAQNLPPAHVAEANNSRDNGAGGQTEDKAHMTFTGPVFIGYTAEQAAALIEKCGWDPQGPPA